MASLQNISDPQSQSDIQQTTELPPADNHTKALPNSSLPAPKHPFIHKTPQLGHPLSLEKSHASI